MSTSSKRTPTPSEKLRTDGTHLLTGKKGGAKAATAEKDLHTRDGKGSLAPPATMTSNQPWPQMSTLTRLLTENDAAAAQNGTIPHVPPPVPPPPPVNQDAAAAKAAATVTTGDDTQPKPQVGSREATEEQREIEEDADTAASASLEAINMGCCVTLNLPAQGLPAGTLCEVTECYELEMGDFLEVKDVTSNDAGTYRGIHLEHVTFASPPTVTQENVDIYCRLNIYL